MKEHPIIFSTEMVKAILDGRKTQTRRVIKNQPPPSMRDMFKPKSLKCPYGQVGDTLWIRETFYRRVSRTEDNTDKVFVTVYKADGIKPPTIYLSSGREVIQLWKPSIHMFRWASRINLEITEVRVERIQRIMQSDIKREGIDMATMQPNELWTTHIMENHGRFANLWDSINGKKYPWDSNPWVWVISFKRGVC